MRPILDKKIQMYVLCFKTNNTEQLSVVGECYHIPADGQWYHVNTVKTHWVYNGGSTPRIHIVVCAI